MLAKNAVQKLEIVKPLTTEETNMSTKALTTSKNNPMVRTVSGSVKRINNGLTTALATQAEVRRSVVIRHPQSEAH
jgi:hypothetical protein